VVSYDRLGKYPVEWLVYVGLGTIFNDFWSAKIPGKVSR
jgi:hypothetical protein